MSRRVAHRVAGRVPFLRLVEIEYEDVRVVEKEGATSKGENEAAEITKQRRPWNLVERIGPKEPTDRPAPQPATTLDAVDILATLVRPKPNTIAPASNVNPSPFAVQYERFLILVSQYRPPVDSVVIEFPAGLIDAGEDPEQAAIRELKEETGYVGRTERAELKSSSSPKSVDFGAPLSTVLAYEPGLTNSCFRLVQVQVDGALPPNQHPEPECEADENIAVHLLPLPNGSERRGDREFSRSELMKMEVNKIVEEVRAYWAGAGAPIKVIFDGKVYTYLMGLATAV
jgi:8-oxo-dGTP pyrophosphatase MutT (NUDIX family)